MRCSGSSEILWGAAMRMGSEAGSLCSHPQDLQSASSLADTMWRICRRLRNVSVVVHGSFVDELTMVAQQHSNSEVDPHIGRMTCTLAHLISVGWGAGRRSFGALEGRARTWPGMAPLASGTPPCSNEAARTPAAAAATAAAALAAAPAWSKGPIPAGKIVCLCLNRQHLSLQAQNLALYASNFGEIQESADMVLRNHDICLFTALPLGRGLHSGCFVPAALRCRPRA